VKNPFAKVIAIVGPLGCLGFVVGSIVLVILFYVEEDWRAAHEWAALKTKWEAKGISFDRQAYTPEAVPDDQNLAAIPLFALELPPSQKNPSYKEPAALRKAMRDDQPGHQLPTSTGSWQKGEPLNVTKIRETIAKAYAEALPGSTPPADTLAQFDALYPFVAELREASGTRTRCRLEGDYANPFPAMRSLSLLTSLIAVSKILTLHANIALAEGHPDIALADLKVNFKLMTAVQQDPSLVGGLVAIGMNAIATGAIYNGITLHVWNDAQLAALEDELGRVDFLQGCQFTLRSEALADVAPMYDYFKKPSSYANALAVQPSVLSKAITSLWPAGWYDFNKVSTVEGLLMGSVTVDPAAHRIFIERIDDLQKKADERNAHWSRFAPWNIFSTISSGPLLAAVSKFAQGQVWVDETRIACALERYRLAHNVYPASLDSLVPTSIPELPHDIMTGDSYHYQLRSDGTFLLYSVGWNKTDEGGEVVYKKDAPNQVEYTQGDWVWPVPQAAKP